MLPASVEAYLRSQPRTYTEEQHGESIRRMAQEVTRRSHARYSALLLRACLAALVAGMLLGFGLAGVL